MPQICIQIPPLDRARTIELEVRVDGTPRLVHYRVESFDWGADGTALERRVGRLRQLIEGYEDGWELVQIGPPDERLVPVMFRRHPAPPVAAG